MSADKREPCREVVETFDLLFGLNGEIHGK
jgi:hypothetical protein